MDEPPDSLAASFGLGSSEMQDSGDDGDDDDVVQRDDEDRFIRYKDIIGRGRFRDVYKGFDERDGLDVAWGIISGDRHQLDPDTMQQLLQETQRNTHLRHKNIIRCFKCWECQNQINLVTELFTSGNLRDFIKAHKQLGADALRKFSKQILEGIEYLHTQEPAVVHGDLRCDKVYVNGNEGTVKIGDLGLVTLLARRPGSDGGAQTAAGAATRSPDFDIWAFGLCMLEMYSQEVVDMHTPHDINALMAGVRDEGARAILQLCFTPVGFRPTATALLERFFQNGRIKHSPSRNATPPPLDDAHGPADAEAGLRQLRQRLLSEQGAQQSVGGDEVSHRHSNGFSSALDRPASVRPLPPVKVCQLKGEDYVFTVRPSGKPNTPQTVCVQLTMSTVETADDTCAPLFLRTIEFEHNLEEDTPEGVGGELQDEYGLSDTDRDIVSAIIKECLTEIGREDDDDS